MLKNLGKVLFGLTFAVVKAYSQNTFPSTGNVGIGTTGPATPLQVNGTITAGSGLDTSGQVLLESAYGGPTDTLAVWGTEYSSGAPIMSWGVLPSTSGVGSFVSSSSLAGLKRAAVTVGANNGNITFYVGPSQTVANGSAVTMSSALTVLNGGNVGIGTTSPGASLEVDGNVKLTSGSGASITFADGTVQSTAYTGVTCGGDFAESIEVTGNRAKYEPGDVLVIDSHAPGKFLKSVEPYSTSVSGIYSTKPGTVGRRLTTPKSPDEVPMAMVGIVPTKVSAENGSIEPGDLLVSSSTLGYAMKGTDHSRMLGAVIGKALGNLDSGTGVIEMVVTLQ